jgi:RHH-type transcriptional regulator, proline utilization regulon repressor / proline dehydrogenase / delta 1-pyrroline-5-carboxylate dehydrogenase
MESQTDRNQVTAVEGVTKAYWQQFLQSYALEESAVVHEMLGYLKDDAIQHTAIQADVAEQIGQIRQQKNWFYFIDAWLLEYGLDTEEGVVLMCLAEALLRIPDRNNIDAFIRYQLDQANWKHHLNRSENPFVNAASWGLLLTGKLIQQQPPQQWEKRLLNVFHRGSTWMVRQAVLSSMKMMGHHFVLGQNIQQAINRSAGDGRTTYSYDMLGEAAITDEEAKQYFKSYWHAIDAVSQNNKQSLATVSIKLTALFPRYEATQLPFIQNQMIPRVLKLLKHAKKNRVGIMFDAEESDRLDISLMIFEQCYRHRILRGWGQFGLAVQAYSKRARKVLSWLGALSYEQGDCIPVRLVKGAYWDSEIKWAQQKGLAQYPVFTRKEATDLSYLACIKFLFSEAAQHLYPQFATHNAYSVAAVHHMATHQNYEFQRLHGMGELLYQQVQRRYSNMVRVYAPVGRHRDLLPYLVRRLLENCANSSFVHQILDKSYSIDKLTASPVAFYAKNPQIPHPMLQLPSHLYGAQRLNSKGVNLAYITEQTAIEIALQPWYLQQWQAHTWINGLSLPNEEHGVFAPYKRTQKVGAMSVSSALQIYQAVEVSALYFQTWTAVAVVSRSLYLLKLADLLEYHAIELVALCCMEAGKTRHDSFDEVREAVDFCRYYAQQAQDNEAGYGLNQGRGVFACISPWNFPVAIFIGQVVAALVAGNTVVAKPAPQTSLIAARLCQLFKEAGFPSGAFQLILGGEYEGNLLVQQSQIKGVVFTGSTRAAVAINKQLAQKKLLHLPFIAETGGQNAMIIDSTALPEQAVVDVIRSAFSSAGQRCSALRLLFVQDDIADRVISLIQGAMAVLTVGSPVNLETDVGPIISKEAQRKLLKYIEIMKATHTLVAQIPLNSACRSGHFVPPTAFEIKDVASLTDEQFGPILHIKRFHQTELASLPQVINSMGFGLTLGIHTRNQRVYQQLMADTHVGNCYVNRDQVGAVVGVQPFGGRGLSGTGPKAGGPNYLLRFYANR